ncbi:MAG: 30S ribosomal protein S16 [Polyangiaceae bacterium]|jgi:small subunit ribosomal protein S16|nr:30S ribosomal protein S16 [Polyangiaceae bacterium]
MAVHIRLTRHGAKKKPYYRIIVADQRSRRDGRFIEQIGSYNPLDASGAIVINRVRLDYWTNSGAQLSATVGRLLKTAPSSES